MRLLLAHIVFLIPLLGYSQFHIGDSTRLFLGQNTTLFAGGNATMSGKLTNGGTIVSNRDLNFVRNTSVGNLKFVGDIDQNLRGDTINTGSLELDKTGNLVLLTGQVRSIGQMSVTRGVIKSDNELDLIQIGTVDENGAGFVEGKMIGRLGNAPTFTFPMGLTSGNTGFKNYLTLTANKPGTFIRVECRPADPTQLFPDSLINGIADEVEWLISVVGTDSVEATLMVDYSGLNSLADFKNFINADIHIPSIALFSRPDTLHHPLNSLTQFDVTTTDPNGLIESNQRIWITNIPKRVSIALVPSAINPVFYIPNVFAPGATLQDNRTFRPFFAGVTIVSLEIVIRDSFNQIVFEDVFDPNTEILEDFGWDGLIDGLEAPGGVYYYEITLESSNAPDKPFTKGSLLLIR